MPYVLPDNRRLRPHQGFLMGGVQYPPQWLVKSTEADKQALGITWEADAPKVRQPTRDDKITGIVAERERRLQLGFSYDFGNGRGVHRIGTTEADMIGWREVTDLANALIATGNGANTINILTDTGAVAITATEWAGILIAAAQFRQPIWAASFALQALDPIPDNYAADEHWVAP